MKLHVQPRITTPVHHRLLVWAGAVAFALGAGALLLAMGGVNPRTAYVAMFGEAFGTAYGLSETLIKTTPLLFCGLGVMVAIRINFWNIGAEGQLYMGAFAAAALALAPLPVDSGWLRLPAMAAAAFAVAALWALIPAVLKLGSRVNEILSSLFLNYVAIAWVGYLVYGPWRDPAAGNFPLAPTIPASAQLPRLGDLRVNAGLLIALSALLILYVVQERGRLGFAVRVTGDNPIAARTAGFNVGRTTLAIAALSGGLAGLGGLVELAGIQHRLIHGLSPGYGYAGIIVALLGRLHPLGVLASSVFVGGLFSGGEILQITHQVPLAVVFLFQGLLLLAILVGDLFARYRVVLQNTPTGADRQGRDMGRPASHPEAPPTT